MDVVAVVRVAGAPWVPTDPNDPRREWPVAVLGTYDSGPRPSHLRVSGSWGVPRGWLDYPGSYLVVGAMPKDGKDAPLFDDQDMTRLDPAPDGQARVYWALPFRGSPPRAGGTKEEFFGRAVLAALEGDPQVYKEGLEEFFEGVDRSVLGLTELASPKQDGWWTGGYQLNAFARGLLAWAAPLGVSERLFAACALTQLGVNGSFALKCRTQWEWAALDADPPGRLLYRAAGAIHCVGVEEIPQEWRARWLAPFPTSEEWLSRLLALKNPKTQKWLLGVPFNGGAEHVQGGLSPDQNRRLAALLDSPLPEVRFALCLRYWRLLDDPNPADEPKERSEGLRNDQPDDFPRLDEHVAYWKAYYR